jgi:hypothetical protein
MNFGPFNTFCFNAPAAGSMARRPDPWQGTSARLGADPSRGTSARLGPDPLQGTSARRGVDPHRGTSVRL